MTQPFRKGVALVDQARPIAEILKEISCLLADAKAVKQGIVTPRTEEEPEFVTPNTEEETDATELI